MANNNLTNAARKIADALNAIAASDKTREGKQAKLEQERLLKLIGDKKRLDNIDRQKADAEKEYARIVKSGKDEADRLIRLANDGIKAKVAELEKKSRDQERMQLDLNGQKVINEHNLLQSDNAIEALSSREDDADKRNANLNRRETEVTAREMNARKREAEIDRHDAWLKSAPA